MNKPMSAAVRSRPLLSPTGQDRTAQDRRGQDPTIEPLAIVPSQPETRKSYGTLLGELRVLETQQIEDAILLRSISRRMDERGPEIRKLAAALWGGS